MEGPRVRWGPYPAPAAVTQEEDVPSMAPTRGEKREEFEEEALVHLDALYGLGLRLTGGDEARAEDLVQETCLKAYRSWDDFEPGTDCRAWLTTILRNTFISAFRRRKSRPTAVEYADEVSGRSVFGDVRDEDPAGEFFDRIVDDEVVEAIDDLDDAFRVPLVLSDLEGFGYREIADALEIPVGTVKSRLHRARRRLQEELYEYARETGYVR